MSSSAPSWPSKYVGVPFFDGGRTRENGWDCFGLVRAVYAAELGVALPAYVVEYEDTRDVGGIQRVFDREAEQWREVPLEERKPFDVLWFSILSQPTHVGVYLGGERMLHCMNGRGTCIEKVDGLRWKNRIKSAHRHQTQL